MDIVIEYTGEYGLCLEYGKNYSKYGLYKTRTWRHLGTMRFAIYLNSEPPRVRRPEHGVKSIDIPWEGNNIRFTLLFENFVIRVLMEAGSTEEARKLLRLSWHQDYEIKNQTVARGLIWRGEGPIRHIGMDEKQFRRGHSYIINLVGLAGSSVLETVDEQAEEPSKKLLESVPSKEQREKIEPVILDMWLAYANAVVVLLPSTPIAHDLFHIMENLTETVDKVQRHEGKQFIKQGDDLLKGSRYLWLINGENLDVCFREVFTALKCSDLKVARAWAIKELFRNFWDYRSRGWKHRHFKK